MLKITGEKSAPATAKKEFIIKSTPGTFRHTAQVEELSKVVIERKRKFLIPRPGQFKASVYHNCRDQLEQLNPDIKDLVHIKSYGIVGGGTSLLNRTKSNPQMLQRTGLKGLSTDPKNSLLPPFIKQTNVNSLSRFFKPPVHTYSRKAINEKNENARNQLTSTLALTGQNQKTLNKKTNEFDEITSNLKKANRYNLKDLEEDETFLMETLISYEKAHEAFSKINDDYSINNLRMNRLEINTNLKQDYEAIAGSCRSRVLVETCYHMLLFDLIDEETTFYNAVGLMLQGLEKLVLPPEDNDVKKIFKKVFALLLTILNSVQFSQIDVLEMCYNSLNLIGEKIYFAYSDTLTDYLVVVFDFLENVIPIEFGFIERGEKSSKLKPHQIFPLNFFQDLFRIATVRTMICSNEVLRDSFSKFFCSLYNTLLQISLNKVASPKKQMFSLTWFGIVLEIAKFPQLQLTLESLEKYSGYNRETVIQSIFTLIFMTCKHELPSPEVKIMIKQVLSSMERILQMMTDDENVKKIEDSEYFLKVYFKLHFDEESQFLQPSNFDICLHLNKFIRGIIQCATKGPRHILKRYSVEFNSAIKKYNGLLPSAIKAKIGEIECRGSLEVLVSILKL